MLQLIADTTSPFVGSYCIHFARCILVKKKEFSWYTFFLLNTNTTQADYMPSARNFMPHWRILCNIRSYIKWSAIYLLVVKADGKWTLESPLDNKTNKPAINLPNVKKSDAVEVTFCSKSPGSVNLKYFILTTRGFMYSTTERSLFPLQTTLLMCFNIAS